MKIIKLEYKFLVFLYAYLRQIDLSLDRSRWQPIDNLREYYKTQIEPERVINYLLQKVDLNSDKLQNRYFIDKLSFGDKLKSLLFRNKRTSFLTKDQLYYCCQKLLVLNHYLKSDAETDKFEIEKLRNEFSKLTYGIITFKLSKSDRNKVMLIEHFLQNEELEVVKMEEFNTELNF